MAFRDDVIGVLEAPVPGSLPARRCRRERRRSLYRRCLSIWCAGMAPVAWPNAAIEAVTAAGYRRADCKIARV